MGECNTLPLSELQASNNINPGEGAVKSVSIMHCKGQRVAVKIFRETDVYGDVVDKEKEALEEIEAYNYFKKTDISTYIPEPYFLVQNPENMIVGLAVQWRDGNELQKSHPKRPLNKKELCDLRLAFLNLKKPYPKLDMLDEANICFDKNSKPRIWIAECGFSKLTLDEGQYQKRVSSALSYILDNYVS